MYKIVLNLSVIIYFLIISVIPGNAFNIYSLNYDQGIFSEQTAQGSSGSCNLLNGLTKATFEMWLKMPIVYQKTPYWETGWLQCYYPEYIFKIDMSSQLVRILISGDVNNLDPGRITATIPNPFSLNTWTHLAVVYDSTEINNIDRVKFFINGNEVTSGKEVSADANHAFVNAVNQHFDFGQSGISNYFKGYVDEIRIWKTARTTQEIAENYKKIIPGDAPGLISYWNFEEGSGNTAYDLTIGRRDLTLIGNMRFSTDVPFKDIETAPAPYSSPNPTPLPSPGTSPSPSPETKQVILIPELGASWNPDALVNCKSDRYTGSWQPMPFFGKEIYQPLTDELNKQGYKTQIFYYDWRKNILENTSTLKEFINQQSANDGKIDLIGYGAGGLLARSYLQITGFQNKLDRLLTVGTPHQGTGQIYYPWAGGDLTQNTLMWKIYINMLSFFCRNRGANPGDIIRKNFPSLQNLLPTYDYLVNNQTEQIIPVNGMKTRNNYLLLNNSFPPFYGVSVGSLSGTNQPTLYKINISDRNWLDGKMGNWIDGKPVKNEIIFTGDGTVLESSSEIHDGINLKISADHTGIINSSQAIKMISGFLQKSSSLNEIHTETAAANISPRSALVIIGYPAGFWLTDKNNNVIKDTDGIIILVNPDTGNYKLKIQPKNWNTKITIGQFLESGQSKISEYKLFNPFPKNKTLRFNSERINKIVFF